MYNTLLSLAYLAEMCGDIWQGVTLIHMSVGQCQRPLPRRRQLAGGQTDVWVVGDSRPYTTAVIISSSSCIFDNKPNQIPTLGIRVQPDLQAISFEQRNTLQCSIPAISPWLFSHPCVNFDLHRFYKDDTAPDIYRSMFYEICASYDNFDHIYTDGSKMGDRVASAAICSNMVRSTPVSYTHLTLPTNREV